MANIEAARERAQLVRLPEDKPAQNLRLVEIEGARRHRDAMLRHGVLITASVMPALETVLVEVCTTLGVSRGSVTAFVHNSPEVQADCVIDGHQSCILRFTSGLVNLMDAEEFKFVAAHELGHFLLRHGSCSQYLSEGSSEEFMERRSRELSADRLGYLATGRVETAVRTIIKTASGLDAQFIRFDIQSFMAQTDLISETSDGEGINNTHPSLLMRCRALLWFSMSIHGMDDLSPANKEKIEEVDRRVVRDLERWVDGQVRRRRADIENDIALWKAVFLVFHDGGFNSVNSERFIDTFDEGILNSTMAFLELYSQAELPGEINARLHSALRDAAAEFPSSAEAMEDQAFQRAYAVFN